MATSFLDNIGKISEVDKSNMLAFCVDSEKHYQEATRRAEKISIHFSNPQNIIVAGMGGSAIGGELLKDWARDKLQVPLEISRAYSLPAYATERSLVLVMSYSGETEESLSSFLDALKRNCMIFCVSSGGILLDFAEKLNVPYLQVPSGIPPRAALPYMFVPLLKALEKSGVISGVSGELSEATQLLGSVSSENAPEKPVKNNFAKMLASGISGSIPAVYGFGIYRSVAQRFKQQFNENSKVPSKWEFFSELNHNEIVSWENKGKLPECFSTIFIRDKAEWDAIRSRIETTKTFLPAGSKIFEVWSQGKCDLARMLSTVCIGDFTSVYLAVLYGVDPTPVETISLLKEKMKNVGTKEKVKRELALITGSR
ncbi:bifunctional phosphoglucose/phosphomannose isomerase [Candidatus Bathyarchaeota archaeon]|nr:bifunctional phosphoglucose/phosphomannose isomerase [Candidatus Bathyarchaeota archaeon]